MTKNEKALDIARAEGWIQISDIVIYWINPELPYKVREVYFTSYDFLMPLFLRYNNRLIIDKGEIYDSLDGDVWKFTDNLLDALLDAVHYVLCESKETV